MTATIEDTPTETLSAHDVKQSLLEQLQEKNKPHEVQEELEQEPESTGDPQGEEQEGEEAEDSEPQAKGKSFQFTLGDEQMEIDPEALFEFKADGKNVKMTLKEMRDAAAGGLAIRNRMRQLSEEKKKLFSEYNQFSTMASEDPMRALKTLFKGLQKVDPNADLNTFLVSLGKQAQTLTQMSASDRKAYELEQELNDTKKTLTERERLALVRERKQELIEEMGLTENQVVDYGEAILSDPTLANSIENEADLFDRIEDLADEYHRQQAVIAALRKHDGKIQVNDPLVFELSTLLDKNPDFDESDLEEIAEGVINGVKKTHATKVLSKRKRSNVSKGYARKTQDLNKLPPKESLKQQILNKRKQA